MRPPLLAVVHILPNAIDRGIRLWVPLFLIWLLLLPFLLVLLPVFFIVCAAIDIHPFGNLRAVFTFIGSLSDTHVEVDSPSASVFIHVY